ncbi:MAG: MinD/ParA family protein [Chromatiales bacterium]|nr:MinD/ParA family protein [Gammaproteobacteria bacterium]MCP5352803.1 MinD/ParA family protein [Chromatiales bacterium]
MSNPSRTDALLHGGIPVIAVASGKGGVGKTSVSTNLGAALAARGLRTMLLDADLGLANVDVMLGLNAGKNLAHVVRGEADLKDIVLTGPSGLMIAPGASGVKRMTELTAAEHAGVIGAFEDLADEIDVMIVDTGAGISDNVIVYARAAQEVVVVVVDEPASITDAYALIKVLHRDYDVNNFRILANRVQDAEHGQRLYTQLLTVIERFLSLTPEYMGFVPEDAYLKKAIRQQRLVVDAYPLSKSARAFKGLGEAVTKWRRPVGPSGYLEFFVEHHARASSGASATNTPVKSSATKPGIDVAHTHMSAATVN